MFPLLDEPSVTDVDDLCHHGVHVLLCDDDRCVAPGTPAEPSPAIDLGLGPGARLASELQIAGAVPELLSRAEVLDAVEASAIIERWTAGLRIRMLAEFTDRHPADGRPADPGAGADEGVPSQRWVPVEVGLTLGLSRLEALGAIAQAQRFVQVLPDTLGLLEQGRIDLRRAEALVRATAVLPDELARRVEALVLPKAPDSTPKQMQDRIRRAIAKVDPDGEYRRHKEAVRGRRVAPRSLEDGMASLWCYGSAAEIEAAWSMVDRLARSLPADDPRTLDQRRFDLTVQILTGRLTVTDMSDVETAVGDVLAARGGDQSATGDEGSADESGTMHAAAGGTDAARDATDTGDTTDFPQPADQTIPPDGLADVVAEVLNRRPDLHATVRKPLVQVVVGLDTLLGSERPAELVGHGPIDADTARSLAADSVIQRLTTDPLSGTVLEHGRSRYAPPAALADHVRSRDQICRGPGCTRRVRDLDHHLDWALGGDTDEENLFGYCKHCHLLKDVPGWHVLPHADGTVTWLSPCGRRTTTEPFDYRDFTDDLPAWDGRPPAPAARPAHDESVERVDGDSEEPPF